MIIAALETARNDAAILVESNYFWQAMNTKHLRTYIEETGVLAGEKLD